MERLIYFENLSDMMSVFGSSDSNLKVIENMMNVSVIVRGSEVKLKGEAEEVNNAEKLIGMLIDMAQSGEDINKQNIVYLADLITHGKDEILDLPSGYICLNASGAPIKAKTLGQKKYTEAIQKNGITFGVGPAGTGKTFLAVACAVTAFRAKSVKRIILTRPAVEAGEKLGFLPGDLQSKIDPYLRPLYDALFELMGPDNVARNKEKGLIEIIPLAYMRGRTLDDAFIILDEAQNTTLEQMKMFLTRMGFGSKMVINGDITQIDLPRDKKSGLINAINILKNIEDISIVNLTYKDVVRHELVQKIINAYERAESKKR
ncbi:MAG: PhoH family protein [Clostridia bacterium]|nr:PhoH family protein [Clostridia bacterium]NLV35020.1 PhoH family protein [Clostridiaceae bacterium]HPB17472.1 PhoH family protein [Clostridia bacterium]